MPDLNEQMRESVDEALEIVSTWGPYGRDINDGMRCAIVLAEEVQRLRRQHGSAAQAVEPVADAELPVQPPLAVREIIRNINSDSGEGWSSSDEDAYWREICSALSRLNGEKK